MGGQQVPNNSAPSLPSSVGLGNGNTMKNLVKVRMRRGYSPLTVKGKTDSSLEN